MKKKHSASATNSGKSVSLLNVVLLTNTGNRKKNEIEIQCMFASWQSEANE